MNQGLVFMCILRIDVWPKLNLAISRLLWAQTDLIELDIPFQHFFCVCFIAVYLLPGGTSLQGWSGRPAQIWEEMDHFPEDEVELLRPWRHALLLQRDSGHLQHDQCWRIQGQDDLRRLHHSQQRHCRKRSLCIQVRTGWILSQISFFEHNW